MFEELGSAGKVLTKQLVLSNSLASDLYAGSFADKLSCGGFEPQLDVKPSSFLGTARSRQHVNLSVASRPRHGWYRCADSVGFYWEALRHIPQDE